MRGLFGEFMSGCCQILWQVNKDIFFSVDGGYLLLAIEGEARDHFGRYRTARRGRGGPSEERGPALDRDAAQAIAARKLERGEGFPP